MPTLPDNLHFLRPEWFYAFIPLLLYLLYKLKKPAHSRSWQQVCDASLLPHVLSTRQGKRSLLPVVLTFIAVSLCITALAGPSWKKLPQPVFRLQSALVILLDLSQSMNATDLKPSRIERAKLELLDILKQRRGGQSALVVYAADAFTVTPLTDDNETIANLVPSLETAMMPAQGSNLSAALTKAYELFVQSGLNRGDVLVITDGIHDRDASAIEKMAAQGYHVSILGVGTAQGSPIPLSNGFLQDASGAIVIPRLESAKLQQMALKGQGLYVGISADDSDTRRLSRLFTASLDNQERKAEQAEENIKADTWQDEGVWLVLPLLFFAALWARKGWLAVLLVFLLPLPQPASAAGDNEAGHADEPAISSPAPTPALSLENLWLTPDQKAMQAFNEGDAEAAATQFNDPQWKASALYRSGQYEQAAKLFDRPADDNSNKLPESDRLYNKANALARAGQYKQAIDAYDQAIKLDPGNKDAEYNRELVKKALEKQQNPNQQNQDQKNQDQQNKDQQNKDNSDQNNDSQQDSEQNKQSGEQSDKPQSDQDKNGQEKSGQEKSGQKNPEQNDSQQKDSQQKNADEKNRQQDNQQQSGQKDADEKEKNRREDTAQQNSNSQQQDEDLKQRNPDDQQSQKQREELEKLRRDEQNKAEKPPQDKTDEQAEKDRDEAQQKPQVQEINPREASITEDQKAIEQWLRRVPDDPGGLLRRKFLYQYKKIPDQQNSEQPW